MSDLTILGQIGDGDGQAAEKLLPLVYDELRSLSFFSGRLLIGLCRQYRFSVRHSLCRCSPPPACGESPFLGSEFRCFSSSLCYNPCTTKVREHESIGLGKLRVRRAVTCDG
jgi:hypothetical protein